MSEPTQTTLSKTVKKNRRWIIGGIFLLGLSVYGIYQVTHASPFPAVTIHKRHLIKTLVAFGRIVPPSVIEVGAVQSGTVSSVPVAEGTRVKRGELLIHLDDSEVLAKKAGTIAALSEARIKLEGLKKVLQPQAQEDLRQAELQVSQAEDTLNRTLVLHNAGVSSEASLTQARNTFDQTRSKRQSAFLKAANVGKGGIDYQMALAALDQAEALVEETQSRLINTHLLAPVDAVVIKRTVEPGNAVSPGTTLMVLADTSETHVLLPIDEKNMSGISLGMDALVSVDAYPDNHLQAIVSRIAPAVDSAKGTIDIRLTVAHPPSFLKPDMTASVEIVIAKKDAVITLPLEVIGDGASARPFVWRSINGRAQKTTVTLGLRGDAAIEITSGLKEGDTVLTVGAALVEEGQKVLPSMPMPVEKN